MHFGFAICISRRIASAISQIKAEIIFFALLTLFFIWCGAYLEYPSDTWEHFRRIFRWQVLGEVSSYPANSKEKFAYFWAYSFLFWIPIEFRRLGLDIYGAFWQLLIAIQIYRLARALGSSKEFGFVHVIAFVCLWGTNVFGFRYYALSSTAMAYAAYFEALILSLKFLKEDSKRYLLAILGCAAIILFNHKQEALFLGIMAPVLAAEYLRRKYQFSAKKITLSIARALIVGFILGPIFVSLWPELYSGMLPGQVSNFGSFKIWDRGFGFYIGTLGVHGVLALIGSIFLVRSRPLCAALGLWPALTLIYPITVLAYSLSVPMGYLTYRVLFAFPLSSLLVFVLEGIFTNRIKLNLSVPLSLLIVILLGSNSTDPWRGRIMFQLHQPSSWRELKHLDQTAAWFEKNRDLTKLRECGMLADNTVKSSLAAHLGIGEYHYGTEATRRAKLVEAKVTGDIASLKALIAYRNPFCGILLPDFTKIPLPFPQSELGKTSGHWLDEWVDPRWLTHENLQNSTEKLVEEGWLKTPVPPFYHLYEAPKG